MPFLEVAVVLDAESFEFLVAVVALEPLEETSSSPCKFLISVFLYGFAGVGILLNPV